MGGVKQTPTENSEHDGTTSSTSNSTPVVSDTNGTTSSVQNSAPVVVTPISRVSVKPPPFYLKSPETWFLQLESQFHLAGITSPTTKFHHVIASLPEDIACNVLCSNTNYDDLKKSIIESLKANKHQMIEEALSALSLGEKRPTQLVVEIKRKFSDIGLQVDDAIVKSRLLTALPTHLRSSLVGFDDLPIEQYAKIADSMLAVSQKDTPFVGNVSASHNSSSGYNANKGQSRNYHAPKAFENKRPKICNAHIYYADRARTCRHWCKWPGKKGKVLAQNIATPHQSRSSSPALNA